MDISEQIRADFLETLWDYYARHARADLPWRRPEANGTFDPYKIMVSEVMLQQTQVSRVRQKYQEFLEVFPDIATLANAELGDVLRVWQGLGYNRRAKFLWQAAQDVRRLGAMPNTVEGLVALPGIGVNTAGAIMAYAYNEPALFIETNVRTVYIHHFFPDHEQVNDKAIMECLTQTLDHEQPREFYWALMDYGSHLKATVGNRNTASKHYVKQSAFDGSRRQLRGAVLRNLGHQDLSLAQLKEVILDERLESVLGDLMAEGMITDKAGIYRL